MDHLERYVEKSAVILVFLSAGYFVSKKCVGWPCCAARSPPPLPAHAPPNSPALVPLPLRLLTRALEGRRFAPERAPGMFERPPPSLYVRVQNCFHCLGIAIDAFPIAVVCARSALR
eukprot:scaffold280998_cov35-Tisochrysis_lutea.AAC.2